MARIFMTGFEAGSLDVCNWVHNNQDLNTVTVRTGTYSVRVNGTGGIGNTLTGRPAEIFLRIPHYYSNAGFYTAVFLSLYDRDGDNQLTFMYNKGTHVVEVRRGDEGGTLLATGSIPCPKGSWYCHEIHVVIDNDAGEVETKVDGVSDIDIDSQDTQNTSYAEIAKFLLGLDENDRSAWGYYDDIAINDPTGSDNNSWIGRGGIYGLFPEGAGAHTDLAPSAGANWQCVDEKPPNDDTDYVASDQVGDVDTYELADLVPTEGGITAVQWITRAKLAEAGAGNFQRVLRHDGVDYNGSDLAVDISYRYFTEIFDQAPDATNWSIAKVNALEAGEEIS